VDWGGPLATRPWRPQHLQEPVATERQPLRDCTNVAPAQEKVGKGKGDVEADIKGGAGGAGGEGFGGAESDNCASDLRYPEAQGPLKSARDALQAAKAFQDAMQAATVWSSDMEKLTAALAATGQPAREVATELSGKGLRECLRILEARPDENEAPPGQNAVRTASPSPEKRPVQPASPSPPGSRTLSPGSASRRESSPRAGRDASPQGAWQEGWILNWQNSVRSFSPTSPARKSPGSSRSGSSASSAVTSPRTASLSPGPAKLWLVGSPDTVSPTRPSDLSLASELDDEEELEVVPRQASLPDDKMFLRYLQAEDRETTRVARQVHVCVPEGVGNDNRVRVRLGNMIVDLRVPDGAEIGDVVACDVPKFLPMPGSIQRAIIQEDIMIPRLRWKKMPDGVYSADDGPGGRYQCKLEAFRALRGRCMEQQLPEVPEDEEFSECTVFNTVDEADHAQEAAP